MAEVAGDARKACARIELAGVRAKKLRSCFASFARVRRVQRLQ
jgi:hypothetical protein